MASFDCTHLTLQQNIPVYSLCITYFIIFITDSITCANRTEFTGYPGNKNDCAHCSVSDKVEFVAQPQHNPLSFVPAAEKIVICMK